MRNSIRGGYLPESEEEFKELQQVGLLRHFRCIICRNSFAKRNTKTALAWAETQISGMCQYCWDGLFRPDEPETDWTSSDDHLPGGR